MMRRLNNLQLEVMSYITRPGPSERFNKIQNKRNEINYNDDEFLQQFGLTVSKEMAVVGLEYDYHCDIIPILIIILSSITRTGECQGSSSPNNTLPQFFKREQNQSDKWNLEFKK